MAEWIAARGGCAAGEIAVAIEVPHGPVVESLMDRGFPVYSINPKQLDRFRDRFSPAGAKDDSLDARVLADALRTDGHCFRRVDPVDPVVVELREWSRIAEELTRERTRLSNRIRDQLWRYYPQLLEAADNVAQPWFLELWARVPTPAKARRVHRRTLENLLKRHRIRRITADRLMELLRAPAIPVAPGTTEAAVAHVRSASERLGLVQRQLADAKRQIARLIECARPTARSTATVVIALLASALGGCGLFRPEQAGGVHGHVHFNFCRVDTDLCSPPTGSASSSTASTSGWWGCRTRQ